MNKQSELTAVDRWMPRIRSVSAALLVFVLLLGTSWTPARAAEGIVVGGGTPDNCTYVEFNQALTDVPAGGTITFNCGPDPVTILIGDEVINKDLTIDGGGLVTFSGYNVFLIGSGTVQFMNFSIANADADTIGGIENHGVLTLVHVTVANNSAGHGYGGGGLYNDNILTIQDSAIVGNWAGCDIVQCGDAGGIWNDGTLLLVNSTVSGNTARGRGAGIYNTGTATIEDSTISGNSSGCEFPWYEQVYCFAGGGIWNSGSLRLVNSTVSGNSSGDSSANSSGGNGGGIANYGTLFVQNTTIANNTAQSAGGLANYNTATLQNSLLADNIDWSQQPSDCSGTLTSQGYNLIGNTSGCTVGGDSTGNLVDTDPLLGPLEDNGGPTLTQAPLPGSPAIDAGNPAAPGSGGTACEAADQRGVARPQGSRCDMGAVEGEESVLPVQLDIKPGDSTNPINLKSNGVIPVAILSSSTFDATTVDPASLQFGPSGASSLRRELEDVNGDGRLDLVLHFRTQQTGIQPGDTQACLSGRTRSETAIWGCDSIRTAP